MHISKNSKIKPRIDIYDKEASIIAWFNERNICGGDFVVYEMCYNFCTSNGAGIFLWSKI